MSEEDITRREAEEREARQKYIERMNEQFPGASFITSWAASSSDNGISAGGIGWYNFFANIINSIAGWFGIETVIQPIESRADVLNLMHSSEDNALRRSIEQQLTEQYQLPEALVERLLAPNETSRAALEGLLDAADLKSVEGLLNSEKRANLASGKAIEYLLTDAKAAPVIAPMIPEFARATIEAARQAGELRSINYNQLAADIKNGNGDMSALVTHAIITALPAERRHALINSALSSGKIAELQQEGFNMADIVDGNYLKSLLGNETGLTAALTALTSQLPEEQRQATIDAIPTTVAFLNANATQIEQILGAEGLDLVAKIARETGSLPSLQDIPALLSDPALTELRDHILNRALADNTVETALKGLDFSALPADQKAKAELATTLLAADSDVAGKSNLDVVAGLLQNPEALTAITGVISQLSSGGDAASVTLTPEQQALAQATIAQIDFDDKEFVERLIPVAENILEMHGRTLDRDTRMALRALADEGGYELEAPSAKTETGAVDALIEEKFVPALLPTGKNSNAPAR